ncbi:MAG: hypothetical protein AAF495_24325 [Pseudomonadota bacterium]
MTRRGATLGVGALALALSACANASVIGQDYVDPSYDPRLVGTMAKYGGVMPMEVYGNPFNVPKNELDSAMSSAMKGANFGQPLDFSTTPPEGIASPYSLVVLFSPARNAKANKICANRDQPTAPTEVGVKAMMVVCSSDQRISSAIASVGQANSPNDPAFTRMLQQSLIVLLPPRPEDIRGGPEFRG